MCLVDCGMYCRVYRIKNIKSMILSCVGSSCLVREIQILLFAAVRHCDFIILFNFKWGKENTCTMTQPRQPLSEQGLYHDSRITTLLFALVSSLPFVQRRRISIYRTISIGLNSFYMYSAGFSIFMNVARRRRRSSKFSSMLADYPAREVASSIGFPERYWRIGDLRAVSAPWKLYMDGFYLSSADRQPR